VTWSLNVRRTSVPAYVTSERRLWKNFDTDAFCGTLSKSSLCSRIAATAVDCDTMAEQYNEVITAILDDMVPLTKTTYRVRRSDPWYGDQCRSAKCTARLLERRYKRALNTRPFRRQSQLGVSTTEERRSEWLTALKSSYRLIEQKRRHFWRSQLAKCSKNDARCLWQTIDSFLSRADKSPISTLL